MCILTEDNFVLSDLNPRYYHKCESFLYMTHTKKNTFQFKQTKHVLHVALIISGPVAALLAHVEGPLVNKAVPLQISFTVKLHGGVLL